VMSGSDGINNPSYQMSETSTSLATGISDHSQSHMPSDSKEYINCISSYQEPDTQTEIPIIQNTNQEHVLHTLNSTGLTLVPQTVLYDKRGAVTMVQDLAHKYHVTPIAVAYPENSVGRSLDENTQQVHQGSSVPVIDTSESAACHYDDTITIKENSSSPTTHISSSQNEGDVLMEPCVSLGPHIKRWLKIMEFRGISMSQDLAAFLLDFYECHIVLQSCPLSVLLHHDNTHTTISDIMKAERTTQAPQGDVLQQAMTSLFTPDSELQDATDSLCESSEVNIDESVFTDIANQNEVRDSTDDVVEHGVDILIEITEHEQSNACKIQLDDNDVSKNLVIKTSNVKDHVEPGECSVIAPHTGLSSGKGIHSFNCKLCDKRFTTEAYLQEHFLTHVKEETSAVKKRRFNCGKCDKSYFEKQHLVYHLRTHTGEKPFQCNFCEKAFTQRSAMVVHEKIHSGVRPYVCKICLRSFIVRSRLVEHMRLHTGEKPFQCEECGKRFTIKRYMEVHVGVHHSGYLRRDKVPCIVCQKLISKSHMSEHAKIHLGIKEHMCSLCGIMFRQATALNSHMKTHVKLHKCPSCPKSFASAKLLSAHVVTHGAGEVSFHCSICMRTFLKRHALKTHFKSHANDESFKCGVCSREFSRHTGLVRHMRCHLEEAGDTVPAAKPWPCEICFKPFTNKATLTRHLLIHSADKPYKCDECPKTYAQEVQLVIHKRIHSNVRPFQCPTCGKAFVQRSVLTKHQRTHTQDKPFKCVQCNWAFREKNNLNKHMLTHTGDKPFECSICHKAFARKHKAKEHMKTHTEQQIQLSLRTHQQMTKSAIQIMCDKMPNLTPIFKSETQPQLTHAIFLPSTSSEDVPENFI